MLTRDEKTLDIQDVPADVIEEKLRTFGELYDFLANQCQFYLPHRRFTTYQFLHDLMSGQKKYITTDEINQINVPKIKACELKEIWPIIQRQHQAVLKYVPEVTGKTIPFDKDYLWNVFGTIFRERADDYIQRAIREDEKAKKAKKKDPLSMIAIVREKLALKRASSCKYRN